MIDRAIPPLALALAATTTSRLYLEADKNEELCNGFIPAVAAMDVADCAYRRAIETTLPAESADAILAATAAFRQKVHEVRERTRREIGELYRRYNRSYGWFDPLDSYSPPTTGLSHADATRVATMADDARSEVEAFRSHVNETVAKRLQPAQIEALIAAKRRRRDAFEAVLKRTLEAAVASHPAVTASEIEKTRYHLLQLADGWY